MSKFPLVPIFSAAHISKWDALPGDAMRPCANGYSKDYGECTHSESKSGRGVSPTHKSGTTIQAATSESLIVDRVQVDRIKSRANMAPKTYTWITLWFLLTAPVVLWDATYCFMRPRSMVGGDLHWIWKPYGLYQEVDYVYGLKALEENDGFTNAQSLLNLVETSLNLAYVYLAHVSGWSGAPLVGFTAAIMTFSKTVLYWAQEYYCGGCAIGHNAWGTLLLLWVIPNGLWLLFPSMIVWRLGGDILGSLATASQSTRKAASGKTQ